MDPEQSLRSGFLLVEGERVDRIVSANSAGDRGSDSNGAMLVLTTGRLIHIRGGDKASRVAIVSVDDVDSVEVLPVSEGIGAYLWAGLAAVLSLVLYETIDHNIVRIVVPIAVLLMGAYLLVNRLMDSGQPTAVFRTSASSIAWPFDEDAQLQEIHELVSRLYVMKARSRAGDGGDFSPR